MALRRICKYLLVGFMFGIGLSTAIFVVQYTSEKYEELFASSPEKKEPPQFDVKFIEVNNIRQLTLGDHLVVTAELLNLTDHPWNRLNAIAVVKDEQGFLANCNSFLGGIQPNEAKGAQMNCYSIKVENIPSSVSVDIKLSVK